MPSHYAGSNSVQTESSGDVVIVVPGSDPTDRTDSILLNRLAHEHAVCIDPDVDIMDPNSPRTITESSSNSFATFVSYLFYIKNVAIIHISPYYTSIHAFDRHTTKFLQNFKERCAERHYVFVSGRLGKI